MVHLVADGDFEGGEHVWREAGFQCMRTESTSCHTEESEQGAKRKEDPVHAYACGLARIEHSTGRTATPCR